MFPRESKAPAHQARRVMEKHLANATLIRLQQEGAARLKPARAQSKHETSSGCLTLRSGPGAAQHTRGLGTRYPNSGECSHRDSANRKGSQPETVLCRERERETRTSSSTCSATSGLCLLKGTRTTGLEQLFHGRMMLSDLPGSTG